MTQLLPSVRDLPPDRHAQLRAEVVRAMDQPRRRPWGVPALAATAAAVVVLAVIVLLPGDGPSRVPPAGHGENSLELPPGMTPEERTKIERECVKEDPAGGDYRLYNAISDEGGTFALLVGDPDVSQCVYKHDEGRRGERTAMKVEGGRVWLPGSLVIDLDSTEPVPGYTGPGAQPPYRLVSGRVSAEVASVRITAGTRTVDAVVVNDTYIARIIYQGTAPPRDAPMTVSAYDAEGNLVDSDDSGLAPNDECYALPDGRYLTGNGIIVPSMPDWFDVRTCPPATPWR